MHPFMKRLEKRLPILAIVSSFVLSNLFHQSLPTFSNSNFKHDVTRNSNTYMNATTAHSYELQTIINNYTWKGNSNRWVPPMGLSYSTPRDIRRIFLSENTVWIGDSTARQDYQTMYALIYTNDEHEHTKSLDLSPQILDRSKNRGKRVKILDPFHCPVRQVPPEGSIVDEESLKQFFFSDLGQVKGSNQTCSANITATTTTINQSINQTIATWSKFALDNATGKFDFASSKCYYSALSFLDEYRELFKREYSVLVISNGIWEALELCETEIWNSTDILLDLLDDLRDLSGPSLFVVWKTFGPDARTDEDVEYQYNLLNDEARGWFAETKPPYMDLADFDQAIQERAWNESRIKGDHPPHFGLEARLLSIEMVTDVIRRKQDREKSSL